MERLGKKSKTTRTSKKGGNVDGLFTRGQLQKGHEEKEKQIRAHATAEKEKEISNVKTYATTKKPGRRSAKRGEALKALAPKVARTVGGGITIF